MLDRDELSAVLHAIATGNPDRAAHLLHNTASLDSEEREALLQAFNSTSEPAGQARAIGDVLRTGTTNPAANQCYRAAFYLGDGLDDLRSDDLFGFFRTKRTGKVLDKWVHYLPIYSQHFGRFRGRSPRILEIGVFRGGSLDMWEWFFGEGAVIVGVDIDPYAKTAAGPDRIVELGDQADPDFLRKVAERHGPFDIIIDDGGHEMDQQIVTADTLFPLLKDGGVLLVEDTHTSYWPTYSGGRGHAGTFMEWTKERLDDVNGFHQPGPLVNPGWTEHLAGVHVYDSVVVLDKHQRYAPFCEQVGGAEFLSYDREVGGFLGEMLATRDAAIKERDQYAADARAARNETQDDVRLLRAELSSMQAARAELEMRLERTIADRNAAQRAVRALRQSSLARTVARRLGRLRSG